MSFVREVKDYFKELKPLIIFSILVFILSAVMGYFLAKSSPDFAKNFFEQLENLLKPIKGQSFFYLFIFIFLKNSFTLFLTIVGGIFFGIFPIFILYTNGSVLGLIFYIVQKEFSSLFFLKAILPHGIVELPVFILAGAIGLDIGKTVILHLAGAQNSSVKEKIYTAFNFFVKILLPALVFAAFIEAFLVPKILGM